MICFDEWPDNWGILFASYLSKRIYGKVRLNKFLSSLQREGLPIKNKFIIADMGPYDWHIDQQAEDLSEKELMTIDERDICKGSPLVVYENTDKGNEFVQNKILKLIDNMPEDYKLGLITKCFSVNDFMKYTQIDELVDNVHKQLFLDDEKVFQEKLIQSFEEVKRIDKLLYQDSVDYCAIFLKFQGFFEFTKDSLDKIIKEKQDDKFIGKNNVLFKTEELIKVFNQTYDLFIETQFEQCRSAGKCLHYPCPFEKYDRFLRHHFHCIEFNSDLYDIKKAFQIEKCVDEKIKYIS